VRVHGVQHCQRVRVSEVDLADRNVAGNDESGADFTKHFYGRKIFGKIFSLKFGKIFHPKTS
jgi:hypothetical protein